jgi:hypothetical protein
MQSVKRYFERAGCEVEFLEAGGRHERGVKDGVEFVCAEEWMMRCAGVSVVVIVLCAQGMVNEIEKIGLLLLSVCLDTVRR